MGPFFRSKNSTEKMMLNLLISLIPMILFVFYKNGIVPYINGKINFLQMIYPLLFMIIGTFTSFITETLYGIILKKRNYIKKSYSIFPGLFLSLILPLNTPVYILIIGCIIASISKIVSHGFGRNILNPALVGYLVILIIFGSSFSTDTYFNKYELDTISSSTPLTNEAMVSGIGSYDTLVKPYGSLLNFFIGTIPGSMAETSTLLCLVAFIYLVITKTIKWEISVTYVSTVFIITYVIGTLLGQGFYYPLFHILSGGLMFGAVFMVTDPVTTCVTPIGKILQGMLLGIFTVLFRFFLTEGVAFSILITNLLVPFLDKIGSKARFDFMKSFGYFVLIWLIVIILSMLIAMKYRGNGIDDPNFNIISKDKENNRITYVVTQKGYAGNIKASIVVENDRIISLDVLSHRETKSKYQLIIDDDYINQLIVNQDNLDNLDAVSSATVTANAFKSMITNVMRDYK